MNETRGERSVDDGIRPKREAGEVLKGQQGEHRPAPKHAGEHDELRDPGWGIHLAFRVGEEHLPRAATLQRCGHGSRGEYRSVGTRG